MNRLFPVFILLFSIANAQNPKDFNEIYTKTYVETAQKDFDKALQIADSLFVISETALFKTKSLMLSASLYQQSGDLNTAIDFALKSEKIITQTQDYVWISRVYGFLATQYRLIGLYSQSKKYSDLAFGFAEKISEKELSHSTMGLLLQEMAFNENTQKNYRKAIGYLKLAHQHFEKINANRDYLIAQNQQLIGVNYFGLKKMDSAMIHYEKALDTYGDNPANYVKGLIHNGIANVYLVETDLENANEHLQEARRIADNSSYLELKNEVYKTSQQYFLMTQDIEKLSQATIRKDSVAEQIAQKKSTILNRSFSEIDKENTSIKEKVDVKNRLLTGLLIVFLIGLVLFALYRQAQRKKMNKIREILTKLEEQDNGSFEENSNSILEISASANPEINEEQEVSSMMTRLTEEKLLNKLEKFEKSGLYTQNSISLSYLATYCETNSKYLSYVINTHKKQDFNNYINELRINYIIRKLRNDPMYRKYKIATLAEESGFSSQNKFSTVFKKVTSISPSSFIQYIEEDANHNSLV